MAADATTAARARIAASAVPETDVCLIVEGCYPFVAGGVSAWIDWLFRTQPAISFNVVALWPKSTGMKPRYGLPPNVGSLHVLPLQEFGAAPRGRAAAVPELEKLAEQFADFLQHGSIRGFRDIDMMLQSINRRLPLAALYNSPRGWELAHRMYERMMPEGSFLHFFWAWRALIGGLFATLEFPLPRARVYHTISTGYAGLLAARARLETGRPVIVTEHGIYTNERRIEILMAEWLADTIDKGLSLADARFDLRDMWMRVFESYARVCYGACNEIITLFEDNQRAQRAMGADPALLRVIANGIDTTRFAKVTLAGTDERPTMALIGRVVPIKDVMTFISAARILRERVPELRAWVIGPTDEDPEYVRECKRIVAESGLEGCVEFTGGVNVVEYMPRVHVVVLSSLSESQPLVLLEAGAAGLPFVATNVGSCREILEGRADEEPRLGPGGIVTGLVAPGEIADAVGVLLANPALRRRFGEALRERVRRYYTSERASAAYADLYRHHIQLPDAPFDPGRA